MLTASTVHVQDPADWDAYVPEKLLDLQIALIWGGKLGVERRGIVG